MKPLYKFNNRLLAYLSKLFKSTAIAKYVFKRTATHYILVNNSNVPIPFTTHHYGNYLMHRIRRITAGCYVVIDAMDYSYDLTHMFKESTFLVVGLRHDFTNTPDNVILVGTIPEVYRYIDKPSFIVSANLGLYLSTFGMVSTVLFSKDVDAKCNTHITTIGYPMAYLLDKRFSILLHIHSVYQTGSRRLNILEYKIHKPYLSCPQRLIQTMIHNGNLT